MNKILILLSITFLAGCQMNILEYENQIISDAQQYQAKISRDIWGVPHISGERDADVAFGLAFAHAEDDIKNIAENLKVNREASAKTKDPFTT